MSDDDYLRLDSQVCFPLYAASNLLTRLYRPKLEKIGLTYLQYLVMLVMWESKVQTVGSVGSRLHLDSGTLTPVLKRMEAAGLLTRTRDAEDERRVLITLSEQGLALKAKARFVPETLLEGYQLEPERVDQLRSVVTELIQILSEHVVSKTTSVIS